MTATTLSRQAEEALQAALAAEHAAVYAYGVIGARLSGYRRERAEGEWNAHRQSRDRLRGMLRRSGVSPVPAESDYRLPEPVSDTSSAVQLAATVEERVAAAYVAVVAIDDRKLRDLAAAAMRECARRAAYWRGSTVPFPGLRRRNERG